MSATITGLGSGFDIDSWVSQLVAAKTSTTLTPLQSKLQNLQNKSTAVSSLKTKFSNLQSSLQAFTKIIYDSSSDMWTNTKIESSNSAYATATSTGSVATGNVNLKVEQVATATTAKSANSLGTITKDNVQDAQFTNLANGQAKAGTFSMFLNNKEYNIEIKEDDSLKDVMDKIKDVSGGKIQADVDDNGVFSIKAYKEIDGEFVVDKDANLVLGSGKDTSNVVSALKLHSKAGTYGHSSLYPTSIVNTSVAMVKSSSGLGNVQFFDENGQAVQSGKITINGVDFAVDTGTTLNGLIAKINGNSDVNVKASYDSLTNKLILTSTQTGQNNISLSEEGTNLLNVLGLTTGTGEDEILAEGSQTLGQNAIVHINGNRVVSTSNTITGESSGISNLSITVKKPTSEYSLNKDDEAEINLDVQQDFTAVKEALTNFVTAYNDVVNTTKNYTKTDGAIGHDTALNSILGSLRGLTSKISDNDGSFSMLSDIGISATRGDINNLSIDEKKLDKVLSENFDSVKNLLSDGYVNKADTGLFDSLLNSVNDVLDTENGYFTNKDTSLQSQISSMNTRIDRANRSLTSYETRLMKQFNAMDSTIAALQAQLTTFQSYIH